MNESCISGMLFCRKCKKLKWNVYDTHSVSEYKFLCDKCASEENVLGACRSCGREGIKGELNKYGGYCHKCENDNIIECKFCGAEVYYHNTIEGICNKCATGKKKACAKCNTYIDTKNLSSDGLCTKCSIKLHKKLRESNVNEIVECVECGREVYVNDLKDKSGLCIYCYSNELEYEIKKLKKKKKKQFA